MSTMTYKNYIARIEFDERDNIFVGRVLGLRSIISFHGETVSELRHEFEVAIDDFLNDCKEQGITPKSQHQASSCCVCRLKHMVRHWWQRRQQGRV